MTISEYIENRMNELNGEDECPEVANNLYLVCDEVKEKFNVQCQVCSCGGFDSPGYDIDCYAIAWISEDGNLGMMDYQEERY